MAVLPSSCRRYLDGRGIPFEELQEGGQKALVLKQFGLPTGRFDTPSADLLILLPCGYPDNPPDMFYASPWLKLAASKHFPCGADQAFEFQGRRWQRWSRHNNQWRSGVDGIWTMLKRVEAALECAA